MTPARPAAEGAAPDLRDGVEVAVLAALVAALLFALGPPWPDDWDGLGFLASVTRFDMDRFAPHPPGYPVYVALLRLAGVALSPMNAAKAVFALSGGVTVALLSLALRTMIRAPFVVRTLFALAPMATPLGLRCATSVGSEAPALAFTSLALLGLAAGSSSIVGVAVGLGLGARASWAPLLLPVLLLAPRRGRSAAFAAASVLAWAVPLVLVVGPAHLAHLSSVHLAGHATRWGGTALTEPSRARSLLRDLFVDGLGVDSDGLGVALAVALFASLAFGLLAWRRAGWPWARPCAIVLLPYGAWVAVGQNLREQPRHVLPIVAFGASSLVVAAWVDRRARVACGALLALVLVRTGIDASSRLRTPPPGAALVDLVRSLPDAETVLVFGGASARFFEPTELRSRAFAVESMGDVRLALARVDDPPSRVLVTSEAFEVEGRDEPSGALLATLCRPARIDRRRPCLSVYSVESASLR